MLDDGLRRILCDVLKNDDIKYEDTIETVDLWDSMMHMEVMVAIENSYKVRIEPGEIVALTSVKAIQEYLRSKGAL
jgi:acyl carrier protein